ncbi:MAG: histone deacetylase [Planctomycetota bacterium]
MRTPSAMTKRFRLRTRWIVLAGLLLVAGLYGGVCCVPPESFRQVNTPRAGVALNGRVAVVYSNQYQIHLGGLERLHPFDIGKYAKIYLKLQTDGYLRPEDVFVPAPLTDEQALLVHTREYLATLGDTAKVAAYLEAPYLAVMPAAAMDAGVLAPFRAASGGTILAGRLALRHGIAINIGGGYHHAMPDTGGGFNVYADLAIAIRQLRKEGLIRRAAVVDLDVHQGNGTSTVFAGDPDVFTFDMHEGDIYPHPKAHSTLDVPLPAGTGDEEYLATLRQHLGGVLQRAKPDIVFLQGGCDVLADDPLAHLQLTPRGLADRDATVIDACVQRGIPVAMVMGGGYSKDAWAAQADSIIRTIRTHALAGAAPGNPPRERSTKEALYVK